MTDLLRVEHLTRHFKIGGALSQQTLHAVDNVSFGINEREIVALAGESGSGKSTIARMLARIYRPTSGEIYFEGKPLSRIRSRHDQLRYSGLVPMVFQDPFSSINPVFRVQHGVLRGLKLHRPELSAAQRLTEAARVFDVVGLNPDMLQRFPYELSGGQRQRVGFAQALAMRPKLILADEPVSMLDVSIRIGLLNLMAKLRDEEGVSILYITHDIASARYVADRLIVMYAGQIAETGWVAQHTVACLANADLPDEEAEHAAAVQAQGWSATATVVNDTFAILRAGLPDGAGPHWGVAVVCGAGINCVGVAPDGRVTRYLALGTISGDWGGGYGLGLEVLWHAMRAEDGRGRDTLLAGYLTSHFGVERVEEITIGIHQGKIGDGDLTGLAPLLLRASAEGDPVARTVVNRLADEISVMAITAMRRLGLTALATPVILGGGVITARNPLLMDSILRQLAEAAPAAVVHVIDVPPVAGAALLGLDHVNAPPAAASRLRAAFDIRER